MAEVTVRRPHKGASLAQTGFSNVAFAAGSSTSQELQAFHPPFAPVDPLWGNSRNKVVSRVHDLVRNDGWASGGVTSYLDSVIGCDLRLSAKPDWRALAVHSPAFDASWAREFASAVEAQWRTWAYDVRKFCDAARFNTVGEMFALSFRHKMMDGDAFAVGHYLPERGGKFATTLEVMHPDRVSNPDGQPDTMMMRQGVTKDEFGAATGYYFRGAHPGDYTAVMGESFTWTYVPRETAWGRQLVIHAFDKTEAHQTRGVSRFAPIVERLKMLTQYDRLEVQAAVMNSVLAAYIESPFDHSLAENIFMEDASTDQLSAYQQERSNFYDSSRVQLNGVRMPTLFPGEKINFLDPKRPNTAFAEFEGAALRNIASGLGMSYEQLSRDWSKTNYSSGRLALLEVWRTYARDREGFGNSFATPVYALLLEEIIDKGLAPLPSGAPDFWEEATAFTKCRWIGPARGWVDPLKEAQAAQARMDTGLSTLEDECAEQGKDYEEVIAQRAREAEMWKEHGLPDPQRLQPTQAPQEGDNAA